MGKDGFYISMMCGGNDFGVISALSNSSVGTRLCGASLMLFIWWRLSETNIT